MKKILLFALIYSSPLFASLYTSDVVQLNSLMALPGFSFDSTGKPVTNWLAGKGATESNKTYTQGDFQVSVNYDKQKNPRVVSYTSRSADASGKQESKELIALLDAGGTSQFIYEKQKDNAFVASTAYCNRVYRDMGVKSNHDLVTKLFDCSKVLSIPMNDSEIEDAQKIIKSFSQYQNSTSSAPVTGLGTLNGYFRSAKIEKQVKATRKAGEEYATDVMKLAKLCEVIAPKLVENPATLKAEDVGRE